MDKTSKEIFKKLYDLHDRYDEDPQHVICAEAADYIKNLSEMLNRRAQPSNEPLTLEQLRGMRGEPLWKEEPPSGDMTESEIEPVLFSGIHCGKEERACWVTCEAHHANALIEHIAAGKINFYRRKPEPEGKIEK